MLNRLRKKQKITLILMAVSILTVLLVFTVGISACATTYTSGNYSDFSSFFSNSFSSGTDFASFFSKFFNRKDSNDNSSNTATPDSNNSDGGNNSDSTVMPPSSSTPVPSDDSGSKDVPTDNSGNSTFPSGTYTVTTKTIDSYTIYTPSSLGAKGEKHPIITWGNGTGAPTMSYTFLLNYLAKNGFVVVATNSTQTGQGTEMLSGVDAMIAENSKSGSFFNNKLNVDAIGATGHSQGGAGAMSCAVKSSKIKCIVPIQGAWTTVLSVTGLKCPSLFIAGSADTIVSTSLVQMYYGQAKGKSILAELQGSSHMGLMSTTYKDEIANYATLWFKAHLCNNGTYDSVLTSLKGNTKWKVLANK